MPARELSASLCAMLCAALCATNDARADEASFRFSAPISITQPGAFVHLLLPPSAYAHSLQLGLQDLRVVDAHGDRVPFALLAPRDENRIAEQERDAVLYPLPARPSTDGHWLSPIELIVDGDRMSVKRLGRNTAARSDAERSGGWLIDLGESKPQDPPPQSLCMEWSGPAEFSAAFRIETSNDLRDWHSAGIGQLMALNSASGPLTQPTMTLSPSAGRFVRPVWQSIASAPALTGAKVITARNNRVMLDPASELKFSPSAEPAGKVTPDADAKRSLHFDLGGSLPIAELNLQLAPGNRVTPARIQVRNRVDDPWRTLTQSVFYRLERDADVSTSPPVTVATTARYLRIVPDERAAALGAAQTQLVVQAQLAGLVFTVQGAPPYYLLTGSADVAPSALPPSTLVPMLDEERSRFGDAVVGAWSEVEAAAQEAKSRQRRAALRPWLLWGVLVIGVAGLAFMVWRLSRTGMRG